MRQIRWHRLLGVGSILIPLASNAQGPQPKIREIATIPNVGSVDQALRLPNGRTIIYGTSDSIFAYDPATKRSTLVAPYTSSGWGFGAVSPQGDRIAYRRGAEDGKSAFIWTTPIDPQTGVPTGPSQRVTTSEGDSPRFSPDGKFLAFASGHDAHDVAVLPMMGGVERILARYPKAVRLPAWSADGTSLLVHVGEVPDTSITVERVPVTGGASQPLMTYPHSARPWPGGAIGTIGGEIAFYRPDIGAERDGRLAYFSTSGVRGEFSMPPTTSVSDAGVMSAQTLMTRTLRVTTAHILNLADHSVRDLLPEAAMSRVPGWSPDGRRIAVQDSTGGRWGITVMHADGSAPRHYPATTEASLLRWSPNGQWLAYYEGNRTRLEVLDLATGATRTVTSAPNGRIGGFIWRPDSKSIVLVKEARDGHTEVYEAGWGVAERELRDIHATLPGYFQHGFISDQYLIVGNNAQPFEQVLISSDGTMAKKLPGGGNRKSVFGVSRDRKLLVFLLRSPGPDMSIEVMTASGDPVRTLALPFEVPNQNNYPPFHPDGAHVILAGKVPGESVFKLFLVPLNGDVPRVLATLAGSPLGNLSLAPDGKTLLFTTEGPPTSTIYELDVSPIVQAVVKP